MVVAVRFTMIMEKTHVLSLVILERMKKIFQTTNWIKIFNIDSVSSLMVTPIISTFTMEQQKAQTLMVL